MDENRTLRPRLRVGAVVMLYDLDDSADGQVAMEVSIPLPLSHQAVRAMAATLAGVADGMQKNQEKAEEVARLIKPS